MKHKIKRALHLDFHTMPGIYNFNENWDAVVFAEKLQKAHVKYVNLFAQCNLGFSYFDTKIGVKYPNMKGDMFGDALKECHKRDIGVTAYFNFGLDHEACRLHPEWMKVNEQGQSLVGDLTGNSFRFPCYETGFEDYKLSLIKEFLQKYPEVDGLFLDCVNLIPCYCKVCLEKIKASGKDVADHKVVAEFAKQSTFNHLRAIKEMAGDRYFIVNSQPYWMMREFNTHVEVESLPGANAWTYEFFIANSAFARNIKNDVVYMTGRFRAGWGDFGGIKTKSSIENDVCEALMYGAVPSIGDHMHPARNLDDKFCNLVEEIYSKVERLESWIDGAKLKSDVGVVCERDASYFIVGTYPGLTKMLTELKISFDIVNETMDFSKYKLLILPDDVRLTSELQIKVEDFIKSGKPVLITGESGLKIGSNEFAISQCDFTVESLDDSTQAYYKYLDDDFCYGTYNQGVLLNPSKGSKVIAEYQKAYFNRVWDGSHGYFYLPPEKPTGHAAAVVKNGICHICFKVFKAYYEKAYTEHKILVEKCLNELGFKPSLTTDLPSYARATITETDKRLLVHVKTTFAEMRGRLITIEEHVKHPAGSTVTIDGEYKNAYSPLTGEGVVSRVENGKTIITLPELNGYLLIAFDK